MMEDTRHLHIEFFSEPVENKAKSREEGRPIFEDKEMVRIKFVGDKNRVHVAPAHEKFKLNRESGGYITYAQEFPRHYEAFKNGQKLHEEGTPLSELPFLSESKRAELRALNIFTAEQLAKLEGTNLQRLGIGGRELKNQAEVWLGKASGSADMTRMAAENAAMRERLEALEAMVSGQAQAPAPASSSPFEQWADEDIRNWIVDQGGEQPHHKCSHETLVKKADELNAELAKAKEAA